MQVGPYTLGNELGRGAMGVVYEAHDPLLDRRVAVKVVTAATPLDLSQVRREAKIAARLRHPHVVGLHAAGREDGGRVWLAMDLVEGRTLKQAIQEHGPLPARRAAEVAEQLADALHYAHRQGVLHRDLKSANVLIDDDGQAFLADFGLSKLLDPSSTQLTQTGDMIGTPAYAAPEQLRGDHRQVGPATDVYGLGGILFEMLVGQPPFYDYQTDKLELIDAVLKVSPAFPRGSRVPQRLRAICLRCLAKEPSARYHTAGELVSDLRRFLGQKDAPSGRGPQRRWVPWAIGAAGVLLGMGLAVALGLEWPEEFEPEIERHYDRGWERLGRGDQEGALADFMPVVEAHPEEAWVWYRIGQARHALEDFAGALEAYDQAFASPELDEYDDDNLSAFHRGRGNALRMLERREQALVELDKAVELAPESSDTVHLRGVIRSELGLKAEALADATRALELDPRNTTARFQRVICQVGGEEPPPDAELQSELEAILAIAPDYWKAHEQLGILYEAQGRGDDANDAYTQAISAMLDSTEPVVRRGMLNAGRRMMMDAYADYSLAQEKDPENPGFLWHRAAAVAGLAAIDSGSLTDLAIMLYNQALEKIGPDHHLHAELTEQRDALMRQRYGTR